MFENIIGHRETIKQLEYEINNNKLPSSILIEGAPYTGKVTIALELARVLSCRNDKSWSCGCRSCKMQKLLMDPDTLLLGYDDFMEEILFTKNLLLRKNEKFSRYLFIRSLRKLLRRFDPVFFDDKESKFRKVQPFIDRIEEKILTWDPEKEQIFKENDLDALVKDAASIVKEINFSNIPVNQIRKVNFWNHITTSESVKIVIIENAEKMNESSRNSMLKILEEPPEGSFFIFLSERAGEIIPTIKSRLRIYRLRERTKEENAEVIRRIFRDDTGTFFSISDYFASFDPDIEMIKSSAKDFLIYYFSDTKDEDMKNSLKDSFMKIKSGSLKIFFEKILLFSEELLKNKEFMSSSSRTLAAMGSLDRFINRNWKNHENLNVNSDMILENLLFFAGENR